ncbi:hypothetical protein M8J76_002986 [Diaphorina citri]|nr:hypothetical protein M8J75_015043 [Diaphorina citri]KAI5716219.1 hypothetical protein M8J76_002986 [Diaphorina citri]KAI5717764.1 hypothetical protein M8J77_010830 [Diaphorina citri]
MTHDRSAVMRPDCPLDKDLLGYQTWGLLHTMAAYYPDHPTPHQQRDMYNFFTLLAQFYPCATCARDFANLLRVRPPVTTSRKDLSQWLCWVHNTVNRKLGKPIFDCALVDERWKDGWEDGSCDF